MSRARSSSLAIEYTRGRGRSGCSNPTVLKWRAGLGAGGIEGLEKAAAADVLPPTPPLPLGLSPSTADQILPRADANASLKADSGTSDC